MDKQKTDDEQLTIEIVDKYNEDIREEFEALSKVNASKDRNEDTEMAAIHANEIIKILIGLREQLVLYAYYNQRIESK